jgi:hypothetical protein
MNSDRIRLAAVLAVSAAFLAGCDERDCRDPQGRPAPCQGGGGAYGGGGHGGFGFFRGMGERVGSVVRGGFGGIGEGFGGGHGGFGE